MQRSLCLEIKALQALLIRALLAEMSLLRPVQILMLLQSATLTLMEDRKWWLPIHKAIQFLFSKTPMHHYHPSSHHFHRRPVLSEQQSPSLDQTSAPTQRITLSTSVQFVLPY